MSMPKSSEKVPPAWSAMRTSYSPTDFTMRGPNSRSISLRQPSATNAGTRSVTKACHFSGASRPT